MTEVRNISILNIRELNNNLDVIGSSFQRLFEILRFFPPCNQATQPLSIRTDQDFSGFEPVPPMGRTSARAGAPSYSPFLLSISVYPNR